MICYIVNLGRFVGGLLWIFTRAVPVEQYNAPDRQITYKEGWGPWKFLLLYIFDYGTKVLTGGACITWSRWFYEKRTTNRLARFMDDLLDRVDPKHGYRSGPALWGTQDCPLWVRVPATVVWAWLLFKFMAWSARSLGHLLGLA